MCGSVSATHLAIGPSCSFLIVLEVLNNYTMLHVIKTAEYMIHVGLRVKDEGK